MDWKCAWQLDFVHETDNNTNRSDSVCCVLCWYTRLLDQLCPKAEFGALHNADVYVRNHITSWVGGGGGGLPDERCCIYNQRVNFWGHPLSDCQQWKAIANRWGFSVPHAIMSGIDNNTLDRERWLYPSSLVFCLHRLCDLWILCDHLEQYAPANHVFLSLPGGEEKVKKKKRRRKGVVWLYHSVCKPVNISGAYGVFTILTKGALTASFTWNLRTVLGGKVWKKKNLDLPALEPGWKNLDIKMEPKQEDRDPLRIIHLRARLAALPTNPPEWRFTKSLIQEWSGRLFRYHIMASLCNCSGRWQVRKP